MYLIDLILISDLSVSLSHRRSTHTFFRNKILNNHIINKDNYRQRKTVLPTTGLLEKGKLNKVKIVGFNKIIKNNQNKVVISLR